MSRGHREARPLSSPTSLASAAPPPPPAASGLGAWWGWGGARLTQGGGGAGQRKRCLFFLTSLLKYNAHTIVVHPLQVCNSLTSSIFTKMCNLHHNLISELFRGPRKKPRALQQSLPSPLPSPLLLPRQALRGILPSRWAHTPRGLWVCFPAGGLACVPQRGSIPGHQAALGHLPHAS